jgi:hypothetical protein
MGTNRRLLTNVSAVVQETSFATAQIGFAVIQQRGIMHRIT